jgi:hypothetical protein
MHQFMMTMTALAAFGAMVTIAQADDLRGAPQWNGNQCFTYSTGNSQDSRFDFWGACPQPAARAQLQRLRLEFGFIAVASSRRREGQRGLQAVNEGKHRSL